MVGPMARGPRTRAGPGLGVKYDIVLRAGPGLDIRVACRPSIIFEGRAWAYIAGPCRALVHIMTEMLCYVILLKK